MNKSLLSGLALAGIGVVLVLMGTTGFNRRQELFRIGDLSATTTTNKTIPSLRYVGAGCIGAGVILLGMGMTGRRK